MNRDSLPIAGVLIALALFGLAAWLYPGGYDWAHHFISMMFAPTTATGAVNKARPVAILAMFVLCFSQAVLFKRLAGRATRRVHRKTLEIGGIGSMVYGFLVVTPLHDLLVGIALLFFVAAMLAALHWMWVEGRPTLVGTGLVSLVLLAVTAVMYYGHVLWNLLPIAQKASFLACFGWLMALQIATSKGHREDAGGTHAQRVARRV